MSLIFRHKKLKLPHSVLSALDPYTAVDEEIVDAIKETYILDYDFRWLILTDRRVIIAQRRLFETEFRDVSFEGLDIQIKKGPLLFDEIHLKSITDDYKAQFYSFNRNKTLTFLQELENERKKFPVEKMRRDIQIQQETLEELGAIGPLDVPNPTTSGLPKKVDQREIVDEYLRQKSTIAENIEKRAKEKKAKKNKKKK